MTGSAHPAGKRKVIVYIDNLVKQVWRNPIHSFCVIIFPLVIFQLRQANVHTFLKFLLYILKHGLQICQSIFSFELDYIVKDRIVSPTTRIIFTHSKLTNVPICLKTWQRNRNGEKIAIDIDLLLEGLELNQRFAPGVYLGIARICELSENEEIIRRGRLIIVPTKRSLEASGEYLLVLRRLPKAWRLDRHLDKGLLNSKEGMEFLAREIARMHKCLEKSPQERGLPEGIFSKLAFNRHRYEEALSKIEAEGFDIFEYKQASDLIATASRDYLYYFELRHQLGHIKRCHGDLKTSSLWINEGTKKGSLRLNALDCIDFEPDFCHIDTLSDVAMLVVDIQMHLLDKGNGSFAKQDEKELHDYFLGCYLKEMNEDLDIALPLLEYYLTEKSMVCAYVSILLDNAPELGKIYLEVTLIHAQRLKKFRDLQIKVASIEESMVESSAIYSS